MRTTEHKISGQLILIAQAAAPLANCGLPAGASTDAVVRLLLDLYVCIANFAKHLLVRHAAIPVQYTAIGFDRLVRCAGRPLAARVYELIEHIENAVFADERYTKNAAADRAKVLRATRQLPKLVLRIENVNKFVMALGKRTHCDLSAHLHMGTVRDFKIKKSALRGALSESRRTDDVDETAAAEATAIADDSEEEPDEGDAVAEFDQGSY